MSLENDASNTPDSATATDLPQHDWHLVSLINLVNRYDVEFPVTLTVGGLLIAGLLSSGTKYHRRFAELISSTMTFDDEEDRRAFRQGFEDRGNIYGEQAPDNVVTQFLHLRDAQYLLPGASQAAPSDPAGNWWRGRVDQVSGFHFGALEFSK